MSDPTPNPALSRKVLTGPSYRDFVRLVTQLKKARSYLEVGVHNGSSLALVDCPSIGVDPKFVFDRNPVGSKPWLNLYQMTSDAFFEGHDPRAIFGGPVDVAFLDGLHLFEFLLRDFINTEKVCAQGSVILLDDCMPLNVEMAEREHRPEAREDRAISAWWTGDVWKLLWVLQEYRPDLILTAVDVRPTGSIAVTGLDPASTRLSDAYDEILSRYLGSELDAAKLDEHWRIYAPLPIPEAVPRIFPGMQVKKVT
jgi:hypothetical protein